MVLLLPRNYEDDEEFQKMQEKVLEKVLICSVCLSFHTYQDYSNKSANQTPRFMDEEFEKNDTPCEHNLAYLIPYRDPRYILYVLENLSRGDFHKQ